MPTKTDSIKKTAPKSSKKTTVPKVEIKKADKADNSAKESAPVKSLKATKPVSILKPQKEDAVIEPTELIPSEIPEEISSEIQQNINPVIEQGVNFIPPNPSNENKWREIKSILEKLKEDTLREIKKSVKNGTEAVAVIEPGGDIYDQASSERDRELGLLLGDREREKIHSIDEALLRIKEGDYGICEECDEDIPLGRLRAMPFTRHCVKCKSDLEKIQAQTKRVEEERAYREIPLGSEDEES